MGGLGAISILSFASNFSYLIYEKQLRRRSQNGCPCPRAACRSRSPRWRSTRGASPQTRTQAPSTGLDKLLSFLRALCCYWGNYLYFFETFFEKNDPQSLPEARNPQGVFKTALLSYIFGRGGISENLFFEDLKSSQGLQPLFPARINVKSAKKAQKSRKASVWGALC